MAYGMLLSDSLHYCVWEVMELTSTCRLPLSLGSATFVHFSGRPPYFVFQYQLSSREG